MNSVTTAFHSGVMIDKYYQFGVITTMSSTPNKTIDFPTVTVCNQNRMTFFNTLVCENPNMAMEKLARFTIFYNADFQDIIAKILQQENSSYLVNGKGGKYIQKY
jgi:hypothetical protein